jgi:hypothetical protein
MEQEVAKIVVRVTEPTGEYDQSNQRQINRTTSSIVEQLNSSFQQDLKDELERFIWFYGQ